MIMIMIIIIITIIIITIIFIYLFIYLFQYLSRGIQFSRASLNGALIIKKGQKKKLC